LKLLICFKDYSKPTHGHVALVSVLLYTAALHSTHCVCSIDKMELREIGWGGMDWFDLAQDKYNCSALVNMVMNLWVS
jgi:hypothetical protein